MSQTNEPFPNPMNALVDLNDNNVWMSGMDQANVPSILKPFKIKDRHWEKYSNEFNNANFREGDIKSCNISTDIYPGFPTDLQAQWIALMCKAKGESIIIDTIYHDRFTHVPELIRLGADIKMNDNQAIINGVSNLYGADTMSTDIRASASLIIAGLCSEGTTNLSRIYHIDRGYENIEEKLKGVGVKIERIKS